MNNPVSAQKATKNHLTPSTIRVGCRYRATRLKPFYDVIVIGSGMGGLTSAALMSKVGKKVLVLEQHYTAGGFTHAYGRNGYEWDVGIHYIGDVGSNKTTSRRMFDFISDHKLQWSAMAENYDRLFFGEDRFDLLAGKDNFVAALKEGFPNEHSAIDQYMVYLKDVNTAMRWITLKKLASGLSNKLLDAVSKTRVPAYLNRTTYDVLKQLTNDESLIAVLTGQWGDCGVPPQKSSFIIHCLIAKHYLHGGYYPVGGASRLAETIIPVIQKGGGEVFTYANVDQILIEGNRARGVKMADGTEIHAPVVISNAGVFNTFEALLPRSVAKKHGYDQLLQKVKPSFAHMCLYIGVCASADELGLPKTNFWIYPDTGHEQNITAFSNDYQSEFPVVYISFPSAKDPSWEGRYPNKCTIEIVAPACFEHFAKWKDKPWGKRGDDYDALKRYFTDRLLNHLYKKLPQLRGKIDYCELSTPLSTDYFCCYKHGEMYGLEHDPERFDQDWLKPSTKIKGLYLTGQDILSCGVVGAMTSGFITSLSIMNFVEKVKFLRAFTKAPLASEAIVPFDKPVVE